MTEWKSFKVGDLFDLVGGFAFKSSDFSSLGIPVIKIKNIKAGRVILNDLSYVHPRFLNERGDKRVMRGDILITMSGNRHDGSKETWVGKVAQFPFDGNYLLNQRVGILKPKKDAKVNPRCCAFFLGSDPFQELFIAIATSSGGQANLSPSQILGADIHLPQLDVQEEIAMLLGSIDDKIDLNRQMNETLESMARAIFKDWFVDYGPVRAKMEGRKPPGLADEITKLFPDRLDDEGKPEGWGSDTLQLIAELNRESWSANTRPNEIEYLDLGNTKWGEIQATQKYYAKEAPSRAQRILNVGDIIVGTVRPGNGSYALIGRAGLTGSTGFAVLSPKKSYYREFIYCAATSRENIQSLSQLADGATYPAVRPEVVYATPVCVPPTDLYRIFSAITGPLFDRILANFDEKDTLTQLRDTLLQKLMTGEVKLKDVEEVAGGAR